MRGRTEDTVPAFQRLTPQSQRAFRAGYVDLFIEQAQGAAMARGCSRTEAHNLLAQIYGWFSEGYDTVDLREAKILLDTLRA